MGAGIMSEEEFKFYRRMVGFRNITVHEYTSVDLEIVKRMIMEKEFEKVYSLALKIVNERKNKGIDP